MLQFISHFTEIRRSSAAYLSVVSAVFTLTTTQLITKNNAMKLHVTSTQQYQTITAYDGNGVEINAIRYEHSLLVLPESTPVVWPVSDFDALMPEHFAHIDSTQPDVVILGTGQRQRFVHPKLTTVLTSHRIGVECMDNQAACRTYNILMAEGRKVALALIFNTDKETLKDA